MRSGAKLKSLPENPYFYRLKMHWECGNKIFLLEFSSKYDYIKKCIVRLQKNASQRILFTYTYGLWYGWNPGVKIYS